MRTVWERMPVILSQEAQNVWLNAESPVNDCVSLFGGYPAHLMEFTEAPPLQRNKKMDNNLNLEF